MTLRLAGQPFWLNSNKGTKSLRPVILASLGVHQMLTPLDSLLIRLFDRVQ